MDYKHIEDLEKIFDNHQLAIDKLSEAILLYEKSLEEYHKLRDYYGSERYFLDMDACNEDKFPKDLKCGILSEDLVFNQIGENYQLGIKMLELGTDVMKKH